MRLVKMNLVIAKKKNTSQKNYAFLRFFASCEKTNPPWENVSQTAAPH